MMSKSEATPQLLSLFNPEVSPWLKSLPITLACHQLPPFPHIHPPLPLLFFLLRKAAVGVDIYMRSAPVGASYFA